MSIEQYASQLFVACQQNATFPRISDSMPNLDMANAYAIQSALVAKRIAAGEATAGYKAALTAPAAQQNMGIDSPVTGVLWANGQQTPGAQISRRDIPNLLLETELGFTLNQSVAKPINDTQALRGLIASCRPIVELAAMGFGDLAPTGQDLVATNSASKGYIPGAEFDWEQQDLNQIQVQLERDGDTIHSSLSGSVMDNQWDALLWLINTIVGLGYAVHPGEYLMTGSIGGIHPGLVGSYKAQYSGIGTLEFSVAD